MLKHCMNCNITSYAVFQVTPDKALCRSCYHRDRKRTAQLINKLPKLLDKPAPLGYQVFHQEVFKDPIQGQVFCDFIYTRLQKGMNH